MSSKRITGDIVKEYLEKHTKTATLTLAKKIYKENSEAFNSIEHARSIIRTYRGKSGKRMKDSVKDKRFYVENSYSENPLNLPSFVSSDYSPFFIPSACKRGLVIGDIHVPYTDKRTLELAIKTGKNMNIDFLVILGDFLDCYQLSRFTKDPRKKHFKEEIAMGREVLKIFRREFPKAEIILKKGNHDQRYEDYLMIKAPEVLDVILDRVSLEVLLDCYNLGIKVVSDKRVIHAGSLNLIHGDEYINGVTSPANPARTAFLRSKSSTMTAHHHQTSEHTESTIRGDVITCWSIGCCCDLHPQYMPLNKWNLGFATIELDGKKNFDVSNKRVWDGRIL